MELTPTQLGILKTVAEFAALERYQGAMPRKHTFLYDEGDLKDLVRQDLLEWIKLTFSCGKGVKGLRLTHDGRRLLDAIRSVDTAADQLEPEHIDLLSDIYHLSKTTRHRGIMPDKKCRDYDRHDLEDLYLRGYVIRVRLRWDGDRKSKGYVVTRKGLAVIRDRGRL